MRGEAKRVTDNLRKTAGELVKEVIGKLGENIRTVDFRVLVV